MRCRTKTGFTLVELLVIVAIIGILSTIVIVSLVQARKKARTIAVISEVKQLVNALELYYSKYGHYPNQQQYGENINVGAYSCDVDIGGPLTLNGTNQYIDPSFVDKNGNGIPLLDPLVQDGLISNTTFAGNYPNGPSIVYSNGDVTTGASGAGLTSGSAMCGCVATHDADYVLIAYNLPIDIAGLTDMDECDDRTKWAFTAPPQDPFYSGCYGEIGPYNYCYIKHSQGR
jgi:prepilin-type N-terminal cleavage/methylation domain-containing protein